MGSELTINNGEFKKLSKDQKIDILYNNTEEIKSIIKSNRVQYQIQWAAIIILAAYVGVTKYVGLL